MDKSKAITAAINSGLSETAQEIIGRINYAGNKMLFGTKELTDQVVAAIKQEHEAMSLPDKLGIGVGHMMIILYIESKGTMPLGGIMPAATSLLAKLIDFVNETGIGKVEDRQFYDALQMTNAVVRKTFDPEFNGELIGNQGQQTEQPAQQPAQPAGLLAQGA